MPVRKTMGKGSTRCPDGRERGRYDRKKYSGLASPTSRYPIIQQLVQDGFLKRKNTKRHVTVITPEGERFLEQLHQGCQDPDQPYRISDWAKLPEDVAKAKIDRYMRTFFGKQKVVVDAMKQEETGRRIGHLLAENQYMSDKDRVQASLSIAE